MGRSLGAKVAFVLGILSIIWTIITIFIGLSYHFWGLESNTPEENADAARDMLLLCTPLNLLITSLFMGIWYVKKMKEDMLDDLAGYIKMYKRVSIARVAKHFEITEQKAEALLTECVARGLIRVFLDRETDEIILEDSIMPMHKGLQCPVCGAYTERLALPGEMLRCAHCGAAVHIQQYALPHFGYGATLPPYQPQTPDYKYCSDCGKSIPGDTIYCVHCGQKDPSME